MSSTVTMAKKYKNINYQDYRGDYLKLNRFWVEYQFKLNGNHPGLPVASGLGSG